MCQVWFKKVLKLEYCFAGEKEIVFAQQKQSIPMSINEFVEMTIFLCLICFSIYDKMQGFIVEFGLFIFLFIFAFYAEIQDGCQKWRENNFLQNVASRLCRYHVVKKFHQNCSISLRLGDKCVFAFSALRKIATFS